MTPVTIVTGFLGSDKTPLVARLLRHPDLRNAVVIVNEFGEIGLDHALIERFCCRKDVCAVR
jgi:G3E family GTPase